MQTCACIFPHMHTQTHLPGRYLKALNSLLRVLTHFETDIFDSQPSHSPNSQWPKWKIAQCGTENPTTKSTTATRKIPRPNLPTFVRLPNMMLLIKEISSILQFFKYGNNSKMNTFLNSKLFSENQKCKRC